MTNLFCDLLEINWFVVTNFHDQDLDYPEIKPETFQDWFAASKIPENNTHEPCENISHMNKS